MPEPLKLYGALGSPYSMKMRALLRYRRIQFVWVLGLRAQELAQTMRAPVIPIVEYPDGTLMNDSTALIFDLERRFPSARSVVPPDPADAFLAFLIEDFADEWLTKAMFSYRWLRPRDQARMSTWLAFDFFAGGGVGQIEEHGAAFRARQVGRMELVGCTDTNAALIEATTRGLLSALEAHVVNHHFVFGGRPSLAEFALFGQLSQLATDPTAQEMMRADFPYTYRWLAHIDDLSGLEGKWSEGETHTPTVVVDILKLIGAVYLPFLAANADALAGGVAQVSLDALGLRYEQPPFKYQAKCLAELKRAYCGLPPETSSRLTPLLEATGCLQHLAGENGRVRGA